MTDRYAGIPRAMSDQTRASIRAVLDAYGATWFDLIRRDRARRYRSARRALYWLLHCRNWSLPRIGRLCNRDHTTILYALRKVNLYGRAQRT